MGKIPGRQPGWKPVGIWHLQRDDRWVTPFFKGKNIIQYYKVLNIWCFFFWFQIKIDLRWRGLGGSRFHLFLITHISISYIVVADVCMDIPPLFPKGPKGPINSWWILEAPVLTGRKDVFFQLPNVRNNHHFQDNSPTKCRFYCGKTQLDGWKSGQHCWCGNVVHPINWMVFFSSFQVMQDFVHEQYWYYMVVWS